MAAAMVVGATVRGGRLEAEPGAGTTAEATAGGAVADHNQGELPSLLYH